MYRAKKDARAGRSRPPEKGREIFTPIYLKSCQPANLRSRDHGLGLIRVRTLFPGRIHCGADVDICLTCLDRAIGKGGVGIHGSDLGKWSARRYATIDVVADDRGGRTRIPGKSDAVLGRRRAATRQRLLDGRVGSIAGESCTGRSCTAGLGLEGDGK